MAPRKVPEPLRKPAQPIVGPSMDKLIEETRKMCSKRIFTSCKPSIYEEECSISNLWAPRIKAWGDTLETLGTEGGMQWFLNSLTKLYVSAYNNVLAYHPKKTVVEMKTTIGIYVHVQTHTSHV